MRLPRTLLEDHALGFAFDASPVEPNLQPLIVVRVLRQNMPSPPPVKAAALPPINADELNLGVVEQPQRARRHPGSTMFVLAKREVN